MAISRSFTILSFASPLKSFSRLLIPRLRGGGGGGGGGFRSEIPCTIEKLFADGVEAD